jgi:phosphatidylglycerol:prolipoprotein diacylglycerol transferase
LFPSLFGFSSYGVWILIGILAALWGAWREIRKSRRLSHEIFLAGTVSSIIVGFLFSVIITTFVFYQSIPLDGHIAFAFLPGLVGGVVFFFFFFRKNDAFTLCEECVPYVALAHAFGRIGCFCQGCCFGIPSEHFGVIFPDYSPASLAYGSGTKVFPIQLLESFFLFGFFIFLFRLRNSSFPQKTARYLIFYGIVRFFLEFYRGDMRGNLMSLNFLSPSQFIATGLVLAGYCLLCNKKY